MFISNRVSVFIRELFIETVKRVIMPENKILAENLKTIRKDMKKSQMEFAAECGISTEILSLIEREKTDPKLSTIKKIAAYTNYTVAELVTESKKSDKKILINQKEVIR